MTSGGYLPVAAQTFVIAGVSLLTIGGLVFWRKPAELSLEEIIAKRRTIPPKNYDRERPVPRELIERMLASANWAPTHGKTEPWRFIVFEDAEARRKLGLKDAELYKAQTPAKEFKEKRYAKKSMCKVAASCVIAICMKRQSSEQIPEVEEIMAVGCAVQNIMLVATSFNLGTYWHSGPNIESPEMCAYLGLENEKDRCLGFLCVAYYSDHPQGVRKSIHDKVKWI